MIEYTARKTKNRRRVVAEKLGLNGIRRQLLYADINHSLSFEQVSDEWIEDYEILDGNFDSIGECKYELPSVLSIGKIYLSLVKSILSDVSDEQKIYNVFTSFISDEISDFNSNVYYSNPSYLQCSFQEGKLLD
jgi:hypothetical protein